MRYINFKSKRADIAEIQFFHKGKHLKGKPIAFDSANAKYAFDDRWDSYYPTTKDSDLWVGLNFQNRVRIDKIKYLPRNDTNMIMDSDLYQLRYWDNGWKIVGNKKANSGVLSFNNIPSNALLWVRDLSEGKEERIFTYEHGKQIWW